MSQAACPTCGRGMLLGNLKSHGPACARKKIESDEWFKANEHRFTITLPEPITGALPDDIVYRSREDLSGEVQTTDPMIEPDWPVGAKSLDEIGLRTVVLTPEQVKERYGLPDV